MSIISSLLRVLFPRQDIRVLMLGLDASGRTTALYQLKLHETVTTIPTIGFNVETVNYQGTNMTFWDVGGCDKIRPLWRHYYQHTQAVIFFIDSNDRDRLMPHRDDINADKWNYAGLTLAETLNEEELRHSVVVVAANKQDILTAMSPSQIREKINLREDIPIFPCVATTGEGLYELLDFLISKVAGKQQHDSSSTSTKTTATTVAKTETSAVSAEESLLTSWLTREDESDDVFISKIDDYTLPSWDHYTHLRLAYVLLQRHGRREGMKAIFDKIEKFIANSPRTKKTTFHQTLTYFWVHMIDYAMHKKDYNHFKHFLLMNPVLSNGGLYLHYYTKKHIMMNPEARVTVLLPDIRPLPSIIPSTTSASASASASTVATPSHLIIQPRLPQTDQEFLSSFINNTLTGWGHDAKLRAIYLLLFVDKRSKNGDRRGTTQCLNALEALEKSSYHLTINYFWIQMITYHYTIAKKEISQSFFFSSNIDNLTFEEFYRRPLVQPLRLNPQLYLKYYSKQALDAGAQQFVLPDLKPLPSQI